MECEDGESLRLNFRGLRAVGTVLGKDVKGFFVSRYCNVCTTLVCPLMCRGEGVLCKRDAPPSLFRPLTFS